MIVSKVMYEDELDVLVTTNISAPVERNEFARDPVTKTCAEWSVDHGSAQCAGDHRAVWLQLGHA